MVKFTSGHWLFSGRVDFWLLIQSVYSLLVCSDILFLYDSFFVGCICTGICPFLLCCPICWNVIIYGEWFFMVLSISVVLVVISSFNFWYLSLLFFLSLAKDLDLSSLFILKKKKTPQLFLLLILFILLIYILCISLILVIFFLLLTLVLVFLVLWGIKL